ncbi:MAG: winged helix-turn-helix transcriptional regulator, partial [Candidatus Saccharibacteria bacterium]|nr:winged helix-turn-helix transcriptional regulator [Candidatus Saccharibacteria bacterium]
WGTGLKRIVDLCKESKIKPPEFLEIGDLLRVNFYRESYNQNGDKTAINLENGDKTAINLENGDKTAINLSHKKKIVAYLAEHSNAKTQDIALHIELKASRTKVYLAELVEEGLIEAHGANKNRTYGLRKDA